MYAKIKDKIYKIDSGVEISSVTEKKELQDKVDSLKEQRKNKIEELNASFDRLEAELKQQIKDLKDTENAISN